MTVKPVRGQTVEELRQKFRTSEEQEVLEVISCCKQIVVSSERDRRKFRPSNLIKRDPWIFELTALLCNDIQPGHKNIEIAGASEQRRAIAS